MVQPNNKYRTEAKSAWANKHSTSTYSLPNHSQWFIKYLQASISGNEVHTNKFLTVEFFTPHCYRDLFYAQIWKKLFVWNVPSWKCKQKLHFDCHKCHQLFIFCAVVTKSSAIF